MDDKQYALAKQGIKIGVIAVCAITAIVVGKRIVKRIRNASESKALSDIVKNSTEKANITTAQAAVIAQGFYNAMEGMGTDEKCFSLFFYFCKKNSSFASEKCTENKP